MVYGVDWFVNRLSPSGTAHVGLEISNITGQTSRGSTAGGFFVNTISFINSAGTSGFRGGSLFFTLQEASAAINITRSAVSQRGFVCGSLRCLFRPNFVSGGDGQTGILIMQDAINMCSATASGGPGSQAYGLVWDSTRFFSIRKYISSFETANSGIALAASGGSDVPTTSVLSNALYPIELRWQVCGTFINIQAAADFTGTTSTFDNLSVFYSVQDTSGPYLTACAEGLFFRDFGAGAGVLDISYDRARLTEGGPA